MYIIKWGITKVNYLSRLSPYKYIKVHMHILKLYIKIVIKDNKNALIHNEQLHTITHTHTRINTHTREAYV